MLRSHLQCVFSLTFSIKNRNYIHQKIFKMSNITLASEDDIDNSEWELIIIHAHIFHRDFYV